MFSPGAKVLHKVCGSIVEDCFAGRYVWCDLNDPFGMVGRYYNDFISANFEEI